MKSRLHLFVVILALCAAIPAFATEKNFQEKPGVLEFSGRMIVKPLEAADLEEQGYSMAQITVRQHAAASRLDSWRVHYEPLTDWHVVDVPEGYDENSYAELLMATGDYEYAEPDWICFPVETIPNDPQFSQQWWLKKTHATSAWDRTTGSANQIAAFVDSGVDKDHEDLADHLIPGYNSVDKKTEAQGGNVNDINGHGTNVAGCIGAIGNNGKGVAGVNWNIKLLPVRASNSSSGSASMSDLTNGALWAAQNGARSISVSYSGVSSSSVGSTGTTIKNLGGLLVWAAGNEATNLDGFDWNNVIVAGASDQLDALTSFSNFGKAVDLVAPGQNVRTTANGGGYAAVSGTSFSAPITNGACALIWAYDPTFTADEVEDYLFDGCKDLGLPGKTGNGRLDLYGALLAAKPFLHMSVTGLPTGYKPPGLATVLTVTIQDGLENYVPGSGLLHYRFNSTAAFDTVAITPLGGNLYEAVVPNTRPGDVPQFYLSAQGNGGATVNEPLAAPEDYFYFGVGFEELYFEDNFETDKGWTVTNEDLSDGAWDRGVPVGGGDRGDPPTDYDGSGRCYLTDNVDDNSDVDGGPTRLTSPTFDLSGGDAVISFARWHDCDDNDDNFTTELSVNGGFLWFTVNQVKDTDNWHFVKITVSDYIAPTSNVMVRFSSMDNPNNSVTESGVDAFSITRVIKNATLWADNYTISASVGGAVNFTLGAGATQAGETYLMLGSLSGTEPGLPLPGGAKIPLNWDFITNLIINSMGTPMFTNFYGTLDGTGEAVATMDTMGPLDPSAVGAQLFFAYFTVVDTDFASSPMSITFEP